MTTLAKQATIATRERVEHLERRYGRAKVFAVGALILLVLGFLLWRGFVGGKKEAGAPPPRTVTTGKVTQHDVPLYLDEIGTTTAYETVEIKAQVSGQIISRDFQDGAEVKKGDPLFTIDPRPYEAILMSAKADYALKQANMKRQAELRAKKVTASQDWDTAEADAQKAQAAVDAAQVNLDFCYIKSPIDGRTGLRNVDVGNLVGPSSPALVTVQGMDPIYTDFTIAEPDIPLVRRYLQGAKLKVLTDAEGDNFPAREGELTFVDQAVQPGVGTVKARAITPNPDRALWPQQFVHVRLILDTLKAAKLVPSSAVQIGQNGPYLFVVKPDSTLDLRQVKPGQQQGDLTVIDDGVDVGETVVTSGQLQLSPGAKVVIKEDKPPESAAPVIKK
jgi:multidrug efflux system membrane fusion protein